MASTIRELADQFGPRWARGFLTFVSGEPLDDQQPWVRHTPITRLSIALALMAAGTAISVTGWRISNYCLIAVGALISTGAARDLYVGIAHHASHGTVFRSVRANAIVGDLISLSLVTTHHHQYRIAHAHEHHNPKVLGGLTDPDLVFLTGVCGFQPGWPYARYWHHLIVNVVCAPLWHFRYFAARVASCAPTGSRMGLLVVAQASIGVLVCLLSGGIGGWLVAWVLPVVVGFQISSVLQFLCEHQWLPGPDESVTVARFLGDAPPASDAPWPRQWWWWLRVVALHLPARIIVLVADLPQHDLHHLRPASDWANPAFSRRDLLRRQPGKLQQTYGSLCDHIGRTFIRWSRMGERSPKGAP
jgi:fatty acid desaturase